MQKQVQRRNSIKLGGGGARRTFSKKCFEGDRALAQVAILILKNIDYFRT